MLWQALSAVRDLGRLHDIASVLIRYGFGDLVHRLGLISTLEKAGKALHWDQTTTLSTLPAPVRLRRALEELGPTFVKLGQILATRVDLFEPEWIAELSKLQSQAPVAPYPEIQQQLAEDLGASPEEIFARFDTTPLAAASIAQVHRAQLVSGEEVIVKVRRPGIRPIIEADLRWLARLAELAEGNPELRCFQPREVVRQFTQSLRRELDFSTECRSAERIAENFIGYTDNEQLPPLHSQPGIALQRTSDLEKPLTSVIIVPKVYWEFTGERVCVQEFIDGIAGCNLTAVDAAGLNRKLLARRGARAVLKMVIVDGFYHADPHPGNVFYLPDNRIAMIDFGMVGRLTETRRNELTALLLGLVRQEPEHVADVALDWADDHAVDEASLIMEIENFVDQYRGIPLKRLNIGNMLTDLVTILRQHRLTLPGDLSLLIKAFITLEGLGRELDPEFDMAGEALPLLDKMLRARYRPSALLKRGWRSASEAVQLLTNLPHDLARLLRTARRGRLELHIDVLHLQELSNQLDRAANRLVIGIIVAALIIGSSIVMTVSGGPSLLGLPVFGLLGFLGATAGGIWLLRSIWKGPPRQ